MASIICDECGFIMTYDPKEPIRNNIPSSHIIVIIAKDNIFQGIKART